MDERLGSFNEQIDMLQQHGVFMPPPNIVQSISAGAEEVWKSVEGTLPRKARIVL